MCICIISYKMICVYTYLYIQRDLGRAIYTSINMYIYIYAYIYIYMYMYGLPQLGRAGSGWLAVWYSYVACHCQACRLAACLAD